jgi:antitoxin component YwqK of YwqJK toxin-antitoxin module
MTEKITRKGYSLKVFMVLIAVVAALGLPTFGDPQMHKWVYVWQEFLNGERVDIQVPEKFTGRWKSWINLGESTFLVDELDYVNGVQHGRWVSYHENGNVLLFMTFNDGIPEGIRMQFNDSGKVMLIDFWDGKGNDVVKNRKDIYNAIGEMDFRAEYKKEIGQFQLALDKFGKERDSK